jgi:Protein of unknown function (DUF3667)
VSAPAVPACRNCGAPAGGKYCPECGQDTAPHPPTAREFLHEFAAHYVAIEGSLWITLKKLVVPGALTLDYFAGRKRRYVHPLRLYLTASVVFFVVAKVFLASPDVHVTVRPVSIGHGVGVGTFQCDPGDGTCERLAQRFKERFGAMNRAQASEYVVQHLISLFPYAMFVLLPVFALLTRAVYWNRPYNYGEHLVFALHVHAFTFFVGALVAPFGMPILWTVPAAVYLSAALAKVFGGRRVPTILRAVFVFITYFVLLMLAIVAIVTATALL